MRRSRGGPTAVGALVSDLAQLVPQQQHLESKACLRRGAAHRLNIGTRKRTVVPVEVEQSDGALLEDDRQQHDVRGESSAQRRVQVAVGGKGGDDAEIEIAALQR